LQKQRQENPFVKKIAELEESLRAASASASAQALPSPQGSLETLVLLSLFQEKGRLIDFIQRDIATFSDEEVGRVARFVHQGVNSVFRDCISVEPLASQLEGELVVLEKGYDPAVFAILRDPSPGEQSSSDSDAPPYSGKVVHRGWKIKSINIPKLIANQDEAGVAVIAPVLIKV
jgi:hypothetical protein